MWETRQRFPRAVGGGEKPARSAQRVSDGSFPRLSRPRHFHSAPCCKRCRRRRLQALSLAMRASNWRLARCMWSAASVSDWCWAKPRPCQALGKVGIILGLHNSQHFRSVADVDYFYGIGQRVSELTYYDKKLGGGFQRSALRSRRIRDGIVARMNQLGMAINVSHCADRITLDAVELSSSPVLVTHSIAGRWSSITRAARPMKPFAGWRPRAAFSV